MSDRETTRERAAWFDDDETRVAARWLFADRGYTDAEWNELSDEARGRWDAKAQKFVEAIAAKPSGTILWAMSEIRRIIGDDGKAMLADLPAAVQAALTAAYEDGVDAVRGMVAAERAQIVALVDGYSQPGRFTVSESWRDDMTVSEVYGTGVADVCVWIKGEIAAGDAPDPVAKARADAFAECEAIARKNAHEADVLSDGLAFEELAEMRARNAEATAIADAIAARAKGD